MAPRCAAMSLQPIARSLNAGAPRQDFWSDGDTIGNRDRMATLQTISYTDNSNLI